MIDDESTARLPQRRASDREHDDRARLAALEHRVTIHEGEVREIRDQGAQTLAVLQEIKGVLAGAMGQDGLVVRIKALESESKERDAAMHGRIAALEPVVAFAKWAGMVIGGVFLTALAAALLWAMAHQQGTAAAAPTHAVP
jgi:hypothetical protein